ncbi:hypothetical protein N8Z72_03490 [Polaribacter sp.]|nr:hypothetical protein [Polaribacter sp.]
MPKNTYLHDNHEVNLILKGVTSILIGFYLFCGAYLIKSILDGFLIDNHLTGMFSAEIIEFTVLGILFLVFVFSSLALVFAGRRVAKRHQFKLWNSKTKKTAFRYLFLIAFLSAILIFLMNAGLIDLITPAFLVAYGLLLYLLRDHYRKKRFILSGLAIALGGLCYFIPGYWSSAISILGIAHMAYGITTIN